MREALRSKLQVVESEPESNRQKRRLRLRVQEFALSPGLQGGTKFKFKSLTTRFPFCASRQASRTQGIRKGQGPRPDACASPAMLPGTQKGKATVSRKSADRNAAERIAARYSPGSIERALRHRGIARRSQKILNPRE